jgi:hypothetical protein
MSQLMTSVPDSSGNQNYPLKVLPPRSFGQTSRTGLWWITPLVVFLGLGGFVVYSTWAAFQNCNYRFGPYLSPFYSPDLFGDAHSWFGLKPSFWPSWLPFSPALLILWAPGGFRMTCYYYRGAYYKAFWADPPSCAVGEPRKSYWGEKSLPLILQNVHRYFLYLALLFLILLASDVWHALWWFDPTTGKTKFGVGLGTLVLAANLCLLSGYTFGCHSLRHLIGGGRDILSNSPLCKAYDCVSCFNRRHMVWAWCSLIMVGFADFYVRMCAAGHWTDWRIF